MIKKLQKKLSALSLFGFAVAFGVVLSGCTTNAQLEPGNGLSVGMLNNSSVSTNTVLVWANEAATTVYSYDFANYQNDLQRASQYFTKEGWQAYLTTLTTSGNLNKTIKNKMVVSAVASGTPIVLSQGEVAGRYTWKVQMPLLVTYQSGNAQQQEHLIVTMLIVRTSSIEGVRGLGIKQFIALANPTIQSTSASNTSN